MVSIIIVISINRSSDYYNNSQLDIIENNINKAIMTCYSIEGYYPDNIDYLIDNYGLVIDKKKVNVFYQALGANIYPDIMVSYKGN